MYYDYHSRIKRHRHLKTKTMRKTKELLEIVLDEFKNERITFGYNGICACIRSLLFNNFITPEERCFLVEFIKENRPKKGKHFCKPCEHSIYFWGSFSKPPRIAWLKYLIEQENKNN